MCSFSKNEHQCQSLKPKQIKQALQVHTYNMQCHEKSKRPNSPPWNITYLHFQLTYSEEPHKTAAVLLQSFETGLQTLIYLGQESQQEDNDWNLRFKWMPLAFCIMWKVRKVFYSNLFGNLLYTWMTKSQNICIPRMITWASETGRKRLN